MYLLSSWGNLPNLQILAWHVSECAKSPGCLCKLLFQMAVNITIFGLTYTSSCHTYTVYDSQRIKQPVLCGHCSATTIEEMRTKNLTGQWLTTLDWVFRAIRRASPGSLIPNSRAIACNSVTFSRFVSKIRVFPQFPAGQFGRKPHQYCWLLCRFKRQTAHLAGAGIESRGLALDEKFSFKGPGMI